MQKALFQNKSIDGRNGTENEQHGRFTPWNFLDQSIDDPAITRFCPKQPFFCPAETDPAAEN